MRKRLTDRIAKGGNLRREITDDFKYDKKKLKHLKRILHNVNISVGTLVSALNELSGLKGPDISPDGLIGGLGYIMPLKSVKETLNNSVHTLSDVADSLADEMTNPHWNASDDKEVKQLIKEKETVEENVEEATGEPMQKDELEQKDREELQQENESEENESAVVPEDVKTSKEVLERTASQNRFLGEAIQQALVRFNSIGTKTTSI